MKRFSAPLRLIAGGLLVALVAMGCGPSAKVGNQISGQVTVGGQPLASGSIAFEPDASQQNSGPAATAPIVDGKYETWPERGVGSGAYRVRIMPPDLGSGSDTSNQPMRRPYDTTVVLEEGKSTYDFDVPAK